MGADIAGFLSVFVFFCSSTVDSERFLLVNVGATDGDSDRED